MQGKARRNHHSTTPRIRICRIASGRAPEGRLFWGIVYFTNPTRTGRGLFLFGGREPALRLRGYAQETGGVFLDACDDNNTHIPLSGIPDRPSAPMGELVCRYLRH